MDKAVDLEMAVLLNSMTQNKVATILCDCCLTDSINIFKRSQSLELSSEIIVTQALNSIHASLPINGQCL